MDFDQLDKAFDAESVNARAAERLHGDDTTVPKAGLFTHFF
jgi:hypothetical protein